MLWCNTWKKNLLNISFVTQQDNFPGFGQPLPVRYVRLHDLLSDKLYCVFKITPVKTLSSRCLSLSHYYKTICVPSECWFRKPTQLFGTVPVYSLYVRSHDIDTIALIQLEPNP